MLQPDLDQICKHIKASHRERMFAMDTRKRAGNALGAFIRRALGWRVKMPEKERNAIAAQAAGAIKAGEAFARTGEEQSNQIYLRFKTLIDAAIESRGPFDLVEHEAKLEMCRWVRKLPVWTDWAKDIPGVGEATVGTIIGEAGDLTRYATPAKLWKRMGVAVVDGRRQGRPGPNASTTTWIAEKYSPRRRSYMWVAGDVFVKIAGPYRAVYDRVKAEEMAKAAARGQTVEPAATGNAKKDPTRYMSAGHIHLRAKRRTEKIFLRNLLRHWRAAEQEGAGGTVLVVSPKDHFEVVQSVPTPSHDQAAKAA